MLADHKDADRWVQGETGKTLGRIEEFDAHCMSYINSVFPFAPSIGRKGNWPTPEKIAQFRDKCTQYRKQVFLLDMMWLGSERWFINRACQRMGKEVCELNKHHHAILTWSSCVIILQILLISELGQLSSEPQTGLSLSSLSISNVWTKYLMRDRRVSYTCKVKYYDNNSLF